MARGLASGECASLWNVDHPDAILEVHRAYANAGCRLVTTNTFGASAFSLARHGLEDRVAELNRAGAGLARTAAGESGFVLGDVGPFGDFLEPLGDTTAEQLHAIFRAQIAALVEGGADAVLVETMSDPAEAEVAIAAARDVASLPVITTFAFQKSADGSFRTMMGTTAGQMVEQMVAAGADVVGANCGTGLSLEDYVALAADLVRAAGDTPVILQPNAGAPQVVGGQTVYLATPEEMAALVPALLDAGVRIIGGCCGTTPGHLGAMAKALS